jgi:hypothetical protein
MSAMAGTEKILCIFLPLNDTAKVCAYRGKNNNLTTPCANKDSRGSGKFEEFSFTFTNVRTGDDNRSGSLTPGAGCQIAE